MLVKDQSQKPWSRIQRAATDLGVTADGRLHVDGVRWDIPNNPDGSTIEDGVFGDAYIQPERVKEVYLAIKPFTDKPGGYPGHAQLHFEFEKDSPVTNSLGQQDHGLVLSVEVHFKQGQSYNPVEQNQPVLYQLGTWTDSLEKATVHHHYPLHFYKLKLNHEQMVTLLKERVQAATADHTNDIYHPTTNSCISTLIDAVNAVVPTQQQIPDTDPNAPVPIWSPKAFKKYSLIARTTPDSIVPAQPK